MNSWIMGSIRAMAVSGVRVPDGEKNLGKPFGREPSMTGYLGMTEMVNMVEGVRVCDPLANRPIVPKTVEEQHTGSGEWRGDERAYEKV